MLDSKASCLEYLSTQTAETIARQIRLDHEASRDGRRPSPLIWYLPSSGSLADEVVMELYPESIRLSKTIKRAQYLGLLQGMKAGLHQWTPPVKETATPPLLRASTTGKLSKTELEMTVRTLEFCLENSGIDSTTTAADILKRLKLEVTKFSDQSSPSPASASNIKPRCARKCYICQFLVVDPHPQYPSLCKPCGDFNLASCSLSLPENLSLCGKMALVTGGRVNLGYHTALRLLRCGANVIVSTRYPHNAELRYLTEPDSAKWIERLQIIGADFRSARDVFIMVENIREHLRQRAGDGAENLDILINNAAQTLTDPLEKEMEAVAEEKRLRLENSEDGRLLNLESGYEPRVRGGVPNSKLLGSSPEVEKTLFNASMNERQVRSTQSDQSLEQVSKALANVNSNGKSSWMQSLDQIPYEDVISAHSVNTFVPLILIRELMPLMGSTSVNRTSSAPNSPTKPLGHIINVTSREGIFESSPNHSSKNGKHVHTNLTKAALNMLTETEAGPAWRQRRVAMNSVDPGYMSAAPEIEKRWQEGKGVHGRDGCPIGWEDGAGRVLWPIAVGEMHKPVWGRLLKHFGKVEVEVGTGR